MALQVLQRLYQHARHRGDAVAIHEVTGAGVRRVTFAQLASAVRSFAATIEQSVSPGEVVIVCQPNIAECTVAFLATLHARAVGFLINPSVSAPELEHAARATGAKAQVVTPATDRVVPGGHVRRMELSPRLVESSEALGDGDEAPPNHEGSGLRLLSSGTTGDPKIVMRDGPSLDVVGSNCADATALTHDDRILGMVPLCHSYGVEHGILAPTYAGCAVHLCQGFDTQVVVDQLRRGKITVFPGVPSIFEMLAGLGDGGLAFPDLRCAYSAGSWLPMSVFEACRRKLQLRVGQLYGSTEVGSVTFNNPHASEHEPMGVGYPMKGVSARIVDPETHRLDEPFQPGVEGELAIHAPSMLHGYVGQDESPVCSGYFFSGDLARLDTGGALTITGRIKLLIDVGALKVNPLEVEAVLAQCEGVQDCVVVALPVTETISRVRALVVPADPDRPPTTESIRQFARARLSAHKVPRVIEIVESLPKSPTGKILRRQIAS